METYEELMEVLEMSDSFSSENAFAIIDAMRQLKMKPTLGHALSVLSMLRIWLAPEQTDALIEAYIQYTSGKLEE